jgi:hypothetical protein
MSVDADATQGSPSSPASLSVSSVRPRTELFLISFATLFFELACIRWFGSMVVYLTFFTNIVLMACFLGMAVGCLASSRSQRLIVFTIPLALVSVILTAALIRFSHRFSVDVGGQMSPQEVFFGTEPFGFEPIRGRR